MHVISKHLLMMALVLVSVATSFAGNVASCLSEAARQTHIFDKQDAIQSCFQQYKNQMSFQQCTGLVSRIEKTRKFYGLSENLNSICFYETTSLKDIKSCIAATKLFSVADAHDESVFDCYRQFQNQLSKRQCLEVSRKLIYPAKREYLASHCQTLL